MAASRLAERLRAWYADPVVRIITMLGAALALALSSIVSFLYLGVSNEPTRLEIALLTAAVVLTFYVSITSSSL